MSNVMKKNSKIYARILLGVTLGVSWSNVGHTATGCWLADRRGETIEPGPSGHGSGGSSTGHVMDIGQTTKKRMNEKENETSLSFNHSTILRLSATSKEHLTSGTAH